MEMGLLVGTPVELVRFAPLGDPVEIKVRGYHLTLRKHEAEQILVQPMAKSPDGAMTPNAPDQPVLPIGRGAGRRCRRREPDPAPVGAAIVPAYIVLTGNPNCGKTTLFNALTGLRAKVGNYAGVTVERKEGRLLGAPAGVERARAGSARHLQPQPAVARRTDLARRAAQPAARTARRLGLIVVVVDASNLQRNLYYATQVIELGYPTLIALNMVDVAEENGHQIDAGQTGRANSACRCCRWWPAPARGSPKLARRRSWPRSQAAAARAQAAPVLQLPAPFAGGGARPLPDLLAETFQERRAQADGRGAADSQQRKGAGLEPAALSRRRSRTPWPPRAAAGSRRAWTGAAPPSKAATLARGGNPAAP